MQRHLVPLTALFLTFVGTSALSAAVRLSEEPQDSRVFVIQTEARMQGELISSAGKGKTTRLPINFTANFLFRERKLPPAGRDALALRAAREFETARMQGDVDGVTSETTLSDPSRVIIASGTREGVESYSATTLLTRNEVDLINIPCDPLAVRAILPDEPVNVGQEWTVPEWAGQMLAGIEAVQEVRVTARLQSLEGSLATVSLSGTARGMQEGAPASVGIAGTLLVDTENRYLKQSAIRMKFKADVGAVSPGLDSEITVRTGRQPTRSVGRLTPQFLQNIPLEPPSQALDLVHPAGPWNLRLRHTRDWFVFREVLDEPPNVIILRLVERGSLICQCNLSPIPDAAPGQHTPVEQFAADIRTVLDTALETMEVRDAERLPDGRTLLQVIARGGVRVGSSGEDRPLSMEWRYYLVAAPDGRQVSFMFAVDESLIDRLGNRDRQLVESLEFLPVP